MEAQHHHERRHGGPSLFFPIAMITIGILWMMVNSGRAQVENIYRLAAYWPLLLVAAGAGIILRRLWWGFEAVMWLGVSALTIWMVTNPSTGSAAMTIPGTAELKHRSLQTEVSGLKEAEVRLDLSIYSTRVFTAKNPKNLFEGEIDYQGDLHYDAGNRGERGDIRLSHSGLNGILNFNPGLTGGDQAQWMIGLTPKIPLLLTVQGGTGSADLDLSDLKIADLKVEGGTGALTLRLPEDSPAYPLTLDAGTGSVTLTAPEGAAFTLTAKGGTGSLIIDLPEGAGARVEIRDAGLGGVTFSDAFKRVGNSSDGKEGVWQNDSYEGETSPIHIVLDGGTGSITFQ